MNKNEFKCFYEFCVNNNLMHRTVADALMEYDIAGINDKIEQFIELQGGYREASLQQTPQHQFI